MHTTHKFTFPMHRRHTVIAMTAAWLVAAAAGAQDQRPAEPPVVSELTRPLVVQVDPEQPAQVRSSMTLTQQEDGNTITIRIQDGQISGTHNGNPIDPQRIQQDDNRIVVLDEQGNTIAQFNTAVTQPPAAFGRFRLAEPMQLRNRAQQQVEVRTSNPPPVMLGITMEEPGEALRDHFALGEGEGIVIAGTVDALPAAKAGLKKGDIIVAIAGKSPATRALLTDHLRTMKPGETLELKIIRKGAEQTVPVVVAAYEAGALPLEQQQVVEDDDGVFGFVFRDGAGGMGGLDPDRWAAAGQQLQQLLQEQGGMLEQHKETIQKFFEELASDAGEQARQLWIERAPQFENQIQRLLIPRGQQAPVPPLPPQPGLRQGIPAVPQGPMPPELRVQIDRMQADLQRRLETMEADMQQRFERIERTLDRLMVERLRETEQPR